MRLLGGLIRHIYVYIRLYMYKHTYMFSTVPSLVYSKGPINVSCYYYYIKRQNLINAVGAIFSTSIPY